MSSGTTVTVREAADGDLDRVGELWAEMVDFHHDLDARFWVRKPDGNDIFRIWMDSAHGDETRMVLVAEAGGDVVGFVHGQIGGSPPPMEDRVIGMITDIAIAFSHRGKGVGGDLMRAMEEWFKSRGAESISLSAAMKNDCALGFYEHLGFERHIVTMNKVL